MVRDGDKFILKPELFGEAGTHRDGHLILEQQTVFGKNDLDFGSEEHNYWLYTQSQVIKVGGNE